MSYNSYKDIHNWYDYGCNPMDIEYFLEKNPFIKTKTELRKFIKSLSKKKYLETVRDKCGEEVYLGVNSTCIDGILGFTKDDHDEIYRKYNIKMRN